MKKARVFVLEYEAEFIIGKNCMQAMTLKVNTV